MVFLHPHRRGRHQIQYLGGRYTDHAKWKIPDRSLAMVPELRQRFNANFTPRKYQDFLQALNSRCRTEIHFRVCETPAFFPESLINTMARYGDELMQQLLGNPDYRRESDRSIPAKWNVPNENPTPLF